MNIMSKKKQRALSEQICQEAEEKATRVRK